MKKNLRLRGKRREAGRKRLPPMTVSDKEEIQTANKYFIKNEDALHTERELAQFMQLQGYCHGESKPLISDTGGSGNTHSADVKSIRGLTYFFGLIGDYSSLLILNDRPPRQCPSMNAESLVLFLRYKSPARKDKPLTDTNGNEVTNYKGYPDLT
jgi:hypothetical protein